MRLAVISFTRAGGLLGGRIVSGLREKGWDCKGYVMDRFFDDLRHMQGTCAVKEPVAEWTRRLFDQVDGLIYIGAAGIAVRAIAPCLKDKLTDPAVVAADEKGEFVIPLLSGHIGGANELARVIAAMIGAVPVVTTASDVRQKTAIDVWAAKRNLRLSDRTAAKEVAASVLDGEPVGFFSDYPLAEPVPEGFFWGKLCRRNVWITSRLRPGETDAQILRLIPRTLTVGIGCRRGVGGTRIMELVTEVMRQGNLVPEAVARVASIDIKSGEAGILAVAKAFEVPFITFSARELREVPGDFTPSAFVRQVTGVDNVCERAALAGAGARGRLLIPKQASEGITVAVAETCPETGLWTNTGGERQT